jgi:tRNA-dihydrouridine synthase A
MADLPIQRKSGGTGEALWRRLYASMGAICICLNMNARPNLPPKSQRGPSRRFCVAPMMQWTDRHCRYFHRLLTARALLYTEMVASAAIIYGDRRRLLAFHPAEHPVALQLGGSDPAQLAEAARVGADFGYDEINLNAGCPSDRVQQGRFGAALMLEPQLTARCVAAMKAAVNIPVTVKHRIGVDDQDSEAELGRFVDIVSAAGCETFIVHARKAWLKGLSPKENRSVPPLDYERVRRLKAARPDLEIIVNGGLETLEAARAQMNAVDGVMLGRAAYHNPSLLAQADNVFFGDAAPAPDPLEAAERMIPYIEEEMGRGERLAAITRHMLGLAPGTPGARAFRRCLTEEAIRPGAGPEVLRRALAQLARR